MLGKEYNIKLEIPIDFQFAKSKGISFLNQVDNHFERNEFSKTCGYRYGDTHPDSPSLKFINERPILDCTYVENILEKLKNELMKSLSKEYSQILYGSGYSINFFGNFQQPLIMDDICDIAKITIMREKKKTDNQLFVYLDVVLYKNEESEEDEINDYNTIDYEDSEGNFYFSVNVDLKNKIISELGIVGYKDHMRKKLRNIETGKPYKYKDIKNDDYEDNDCELYFSINKEFKNKLISELGREGYEEYMWEKLTKTNLLESDNSRQLRNVTGGGIK